MSLKAQMDRGLVGHGILAVAALAAGAARAQSSPSGGNATIYLATYAKAIYVLDEATMTVAAKIPTRVGNTFGFTLSYDRRRLYTLDVTAQHVEVVDLATRTSVDTFSLTRATPIIRRCCTGSVMRKSPV